MPYNSTDIKLLGLGCSSAGRVFTCTHEDLNSVSGIPEPGMLVHSCNISTWEVEGSDTWVNRLNYMSS